MPLAAQKQSVQTDRLFRPYIHPRCTRALSRSSSQKRKKRCKNTDDEEIGLKSTLPMENTLLTRKLFRTLLGKVVYQTFIDLWRCHKLVQGA